MIDVYLRGALAWSVAHILMLGPILMLIFFIAVKGQARGLLVFGALVLAGGIASGLVFGGPLAMLARALLPGSGWRVALGFRLGAALGVLEAVLLMRPPRRRKGVKAP